MKRLSSAEYYPILLNIQRKKCIVVGGGEVALRKVRTLLEAGAAVLVIAPTPCSELIALAQDKTIDVLYRNYQPGDLKGAFAVVSATSEAEVNEKVASEAERRGILVNVVDNPEQSNFIVPSTLRRGDLTIAVSTAGKSPALARKIRTRLEADFGAESASLIALISEVRSELKQQGITVDSDTWQDTLDLDWLIRMIRTGQSDKAKATLLKNLKKPR
jgi:siroheme synthase-like protein